MLAVAQQTMPMFAQDAGLLVDSLVITVPVLTTWKDTSTADCEAAYTNHIDLCQFGHDTTWCTRVRMPASEKRAVLLRTSEMTTCFSSSVLGSFRIVCTGTIWLAKRPEARAAAARAWLCAANLSCTSREMPYLAATFSDVTPVRREHAGRATFSAHLVASSLTLARIDILITSNSRIWCGKGVERTAQRFDDRKP